MAGTRCSPTCSTALEPLAVWSLACWSRHWLESLLPPFPAPQPPLSLFLQFLLQLVEEAPVGALGEYFLGGAFDHTNLVQAQGVEAHCIRGVVLAPASIGDLLHRLQGVVVARRKALLHDELGGTFRLQGADGGRLQDGAHRALRGHRMGADERAVPRHHTAEVL